MVIYGHDVVMKKTKVSELKAHLCSYLAEVKRGDSLIVCERTTPIARIIPIESESAGFHVVEAGKPLRELTRIRPVRLRKKMNVGKILREARGEK